MASETIPGADDVPRGGVEALDEWTLALRGWSQEEQCADNPVFWGPYAACSPGDWVPVRNVEHLAVLVSTATDSSSNVCFVSGEPGLERCYVNLIGLIRREVLGWAVVVNDPGLGLRDVRRHDYPYDNYDSFSALAAAVVARSWIASGRLPEGLVTRRRTR